MKSDQLKACIEALRAFHQEKHLELSTSVSSELTAIIAALEDCLEEAANKRRVSYETCQKALELMAKGLSVVTNLNALIDQFFHSD